MFSHALIGAGTFLTSPLNFQVAQPCWKVVFPISVCPRCYNRPLRVLMVIIQESGAAGYLP